MHVFLCLYGFHLLMEDCCCLQTLGTTMEENEAEYAPIVWLGSVLLAWLLTHVLHQQQWAVVLGLGKSGRTRWSSALQLQKGHNKEPFKTILSNNNRLHLQAHKIKITGCTWMMHILHDEAHAANQHYLNTRVWSITWFFGYMRDWARLLSKPLPLCVHFAMYPFRF